jgi:hypothetical protein
MFTTELIAMLDKSKAGKTALNFHLHGTSVVGVVRQVLQDAVVVSNQEYTRILIRFDRINAVAGH